MKITFTTIITCMIFTLISFPLAFGEIPAPKSYYDFQEGTGTDVTDLGIAGNNGTLMGDFINWADEGIITKQGDTAKCIEFTGGPKMGMGYVLIPYQDFLNSPNYTLSAWVNWQGDPDWGYVFWMQGTVWPEEDKSRHIDVWWHKNKRCIASILHLEDGTDWRIEYTSDEFGIEVHDGSWHLVAVTLENNRIYSLYIDSIIAVKDTTEIPVISNNVDDLWLGGRPNDTTGDEPSKMVGFMDRVRIWDTVLDEAQIEYLFLCEGPDGGIVGVEAPEIIHTVKTFNLMQNYPNPFNPTTQISYILDNTQHTNLTVYNILGHNVRTLVTGIQHAGEHSVDWDGKNDQGQIVPSGIYFCKLVSGNKNAVRKMMLIQ